MGCTASQPEAAPTLSAAPEPHVKVVDEKPMSDVLVLDSADHEAELKASKKLAELEAYNDIFEIKDTTHSTAKKVDHNAAAEDSNGNAGTQHGDGFAVNNPAPLSLLPPGPDTREAAHVLPAFCAMVLVVSFSTRLYLSRATPIWAHRPLKPCPHALWNRGPLLFLRPSAAFGTLKGSTGANAKPGWLSLDDDLDEPKPAKRGSFGTAVAPQLVLGGASKGTLVISEPAHVTPSKSGECGRTPFLCAPSLR